MENLIELLKKRSVKAGPEIKAEKGRDQGRRCV